MQNLGVILRTFWEKAVSYLTLQMSLTDIIEIIIISVLIYYMLVWIKDTRAWMLLRGILVILAFVLLAVLFEMNTIVWIADKLFNVAMIAVVVIFQPEMRKALENLGRKNILVNLFNFDFNKVENGKFSDKTITELVKACYEMGKVKTGALIVVEDEIVLTEYERTGIAVDGILTSQLTPVSTPQDSKVFPRFMPTPMSLIISAIVISLALAAEAETEPHTPAATAAAERAARDLLSIFISKFPFFANLRAHFAHLSIL